MKYKLEDLERMSKKDLIETYRKSKTSVKKGILTTLANSRKFAILMNSMYPEELEKMAKIHPYKEVIIDTMIHEMESHGAQMARCFGINHSQRINFNKFMDILQHKSLFARVKESLTGKHALPEALPKKIKQVEKLCEYEERRNNATGKKIEKLETQGLDQAVDESRVEVNNGEMAKVFDRYAKETYKDGMYGNTVKAQITEEYMSILGAGNKDVARLVANAEFENYSGEMLYVPYRRKFYS